MDWLGRMIGLPDDFIHSNPNTHGGGVIQTTASEATFVCLLAGRTEAIKRYQVHALPKSFLPAFSILSLRIADTLIPGSERCLHISQLVHISAENFCFALQIF